jgi:hypothetical protein
MRGINNAFAMAPIVDQVLAREAAPAEGQEKAPGADTIQVQQPATPAEGQEPAAPAEVQEKAPGADTIQVQQPDAPEPGADTAEVQQPGASSVPEEAPDADPAQQGDARTPRTQLVLDEFNIDLDGNYAEAKAATKEKTSELERDLEALKAQMIKDETECKAAELTAELKNIDLKKKRTEFETARNAAKKSKDEATLTKHRCAVNNKNAQAMEAEIVRNQTTQGHLAQLQEDTHSKEWFKKRAVQKKKNRCDSQARRNNAKKQKLDNVPVSATESNVQCSE